MIPCARESEVEMRVPVDPYLWQVNGAAWFARSDCPTADDALWALWPDSWLWLDETAVRLGWCSTGGVGYWREVARDFPAAVECWVVTV